MLTRLIVTLQENEISLSRPIGSLLSGSPHRRPRRKFLNRRIKASRLYAPLCLPQPDTQDLLRFRQLLPPVVQANAKCRPEQARAKKTQMRIGQRRNRSIVVEGTDRGGCVRNNSSMLSGRIEDPEDKISRGVPEIYISHIGGLVLSGGTKVGVQSTGGKESVTYVSCDYYLACCSSVHVLACDPPNGELFSKGQKLTLPELPPHKSARNSHGLIQKKSALRTLPASPTRSPRQLPGGEGKMRLVLPVLGDRPAPSAQKRKAAADIGTGNVSTSGKVSVCIMTDEAVSQALVSPWWTETDDP